MRLPRVFGKKRGHRRTDVESWGAVADVAYHALLVVAGLVFGGLLISGVTLPEWRINHDFLVTRCTILGTGLVRRTVEDPPQRFSTTWRPCLHVRYESEGVVREAWSRLGQAHATPRRERALARLQAWRVGQTVTGWYDPANPGSVVLERGYSWWSWLFTLLLPGALLAFGGSGLARAVARWGRSDESLAAVEAEPGLLDPVLGGVREAPDHPGVPGCEDLVNSPGTLLRYRLPIESPTGWRIIGLGLFAAIWNAVLAVLAVSSGFDTGAPGTDRLLLTLLVPFAVVGLVAIGAFLRAFLRLNAVGASQLEISDHPLRPGGVYDLLLAQSGTGSLAVLELVLELEEEATFRQGTDTRTDRLVVASRTIHSWRDIVLSPGTRFEGRATVMIPADAMHSFVSEHNAVRWRIAVRGRPERRPAFTRLFPVVVFPAAVPAAAGAGAPGGGP